MILSRHIKSGKHLIKTEELSEYEVLWDVFSFFLFPFFLN